MRKALVYGVGVAAGIAVIFTIVVGWFFVRVVRPGVVAGKSYRRATVIYASVNRLPRIPPGNERLAKTLRVVGALASEVSELERALASATQVGTSMLHGLSRSMVLQRELADVVTMHGELLQREQLAWEDYADDAATIHYAISQEGFKDTTVANLWYRCHSEQSSRCLAVQLAALLDLSRDRAEFEAGDRIRDLPIVVPPVDTSMINVLELTPIIGSLTKTMGMTASHPVDR